MAPLFNVGSPLQNVLIIQSCVCRLRPFRCRIPPTPAAMPTGRYRRQTRPSPGPRARTQERGSSVVQSASDNLPRKVFWFAPPPGRPHRMPGAVIAPAASRPSGSCHADLLLPFTPCARPPVRRLTLSARAESSPAPFSLAAKKKTSIILKTTEGEHGMFKHVRGRINGQICRCFAFFLPLEVLANGHLIEQIHIG